ncbi:reverse transcriptase domain-containing protein [Devosia sp.]|uniref:reverse transcriptase domain-containing protein n=1 Tax=Devosia sp. TaxID=1871048 RepID=UPI0019DB2517|nr:reverse transcriptase domain-containing protein [Devosia sp.]MBE0577991.1 hypothetical protein [Devosia sp.]
MGAKIVDLVTKRYHPHSVFYHLGKRGGHVEALRLHTQSSFFSRFDLENFYGNVIRSKVTRSLRSLGFGSRQAFDWATESVVVQGSRKALPQGFVQSPILATLALERSALGLALIGLSNAVRVSVYMDDIILSAGTKEEVLEASSKLMQAANEAEYPLASSKKALAEYGIQAFNCNLQFGHMALTEGRMADFANQWLEGSPYAKSAIDRYVSIINPADLERLRNVLRIT